MRKVIGVGETVLDIIFKNEEPVSAVPGGSVYNGIISLGRAGVPAMFISEVGNDRIGKKTIDFLEKNGVNAANVNMYPGSKSPISLAFLDENNDAEYLFYKDHPHDRLDYVCPDIQRDDIVMIGSYYSINPVIRPQVSTVLMQARDAGAIIYYDVNFRPTHANEVMKLTPNILDNFGYADIVRGSKDDFKVMYGMDTPDKVYNSEISFYCKKFIYTNGAQPVELRAESGLKKSYPITAKNTVSTIGAGDNFNAGLVYGLVKYGITRNVIDTGLTEELWDKVITCALEFSANCCMSIMNYVDETFGKKMKEALNKATE
ncbi:MAG: carbohydrate kinase [Prevotella sp.]|nr:carbohydrate kinase [Prevotella sp.]